jgi:hypothetical protein
MSTNVPTTPRILRWRLDAGSADQVAVTLRPTLGYLGRLSGSNTSGLRRDARV